MMSIKAYLVAAHGLEAGLQRLGEPLGAEEEDQLQELHAHEHDGDDGADLCMFFFFGSMSQQ